MSTQPHAVELRIDEIVVHGVDIERPHGLAEAFETAFSRLLLDRGVPPGWVAGTVGAPDRPLFTVLPRSAAVEEVADGLARTVYEGLGG
ncbi:hypothetical protein J7E93_21870 [Streptomyces sp. ISL-36]|uniref:hypothetical protein n=1 Tax=Streptomyces sp. ISL-36 TaxID=2819182 RepID=UPI001BEB4CD8|nr:hypothetical protein [Streptomyces sp. ISL-36]MBT2442707.1 hypothetical protein [Streptomyces sp. ISL-36]